MISYPDNFELISAKFDAQGFDSLAPTERVVYCIWWLEAEVNNGGFDQFFFMQTNFLKKKQIIVVVFLKDLNFLRHIQGLKKVKSTHEG